MIQVLIQAIPWEQNRVKRAVSLSRQTGGRIVWDRAQDAFDTWQSVLKEAGTDAVVILEDDVELAPRWRIQVEKAVAVRPESVIQFFSMRQKDLTEGSRWEPGRTFMMNQCYYLPEGLAGELLEYSRTWLDRYPEEPNAYDMTMAKYMQERGMKYWLHVPSLVQHEKWVSEIHSRRPRGRQSKTFEGDNSDR